MNKLIVITAPSGSGKTTIVRHLLSSFDNLAFSISATTRPRRPHEQDGRDYYFLSPDAFHRLVEQGAFLEWEEVYPGQYYGTLKSEVDRLASDGRHIIFDIDVRGALNIKKAFPERTLAVFIKSPSLHVLSERLRRRKTESDESLQKRIARAKEEMTYESQFDYVLVNDQLDGALEEAQRVVGEFLREGVKE